MSTPGRPYVTAFAILSVDGRVLPPLAEDLVWQSAALDEFDAVALDDCSVGDVESALSVWLGHDSASAATQERAAHISGRAILFSTRPVTTPLPPQVTILRERAGLDHRLRRLHRDFQTDRLLCPLGCRICPDLIVHDLVDELRLTMRPSVLGGRRFPTLSGRLDAGLPQSTRWSLRQVMRKDDDCGLIYRRT